MYKLYVEMKQFKAVLIDNISLTKIIFPIEQKSHTHSCFIGIYKKKKIVRLQKNEVQS